MFSEIVECFEIFSLVSHFRPKLVDWNESVYCTPVNRALKMWFNEGLGRFLRPTISGVMKVFVKSNGQMVLWTKQIHKYKKIFNNFSSQNKDF